MLVPSSSHKTLGIRWYIVLISANVYTTGHLRENVF